MRRSQSSYSIARANMPAPKAKASRGRREGIIMFEFMRKWKPCRFCGKINRNGQYRREIAAPTWDGWYSPSERRYFHEECLRAALESEDKDSIYPALFIVKCIRRKAQKHRRKQEWQQMRLAEAKEASERLEIDLRALYG